MNLTATQISEFVNIAAFFADPDGDVSQVNTIAATINFLAENPERAAAPLTSEEEARLFRDVCEYAGIDADGEHVEDDE